jgi:S1-C subfamily serine protease
MGLDVTRDLAVTNSQPVDHGILIIRFTEDTSGKSPAKQAGLQQGDVLVAVNDTPVASNGELAGSLLVLKPGTQVHLTLQRGHASLRVTATLGERPVSGDR